ncbi:hypothetical protein SBOR_6180 [Sclerotinia borealis F-4128]|uniref:Chromo domain-containing protein n=1 Tax=Sclerotinia borealis (strain F-4128) TaxID=1432307 RepID=W9CC97_SCLBF|nr:hypothetical protein SBOR_6180 [Sclerotinia borealis F-4128]
MEKLRVPPDEVPETLYLVHDPSKDLLPGDVSHSPKNSYSPRDIGFRPFNLLSLSQKAARGSFTRRRGAGDGLGRDSLSIYAAVTNDVEAARNEVITSENELVLYELKGRCDDMKRCAIFKAEDLWRGQDIREIEEEDDEDLRDERQKKLRSEWLVWPSVPKEAIHDVMTKEEILKETEREEQASQDPQDSQASVQQNTAADLSRDFKHKTTTKIKTRFSSSSDGENASGFVCKNLGSNDKPQYMAIPSGEVKFPFSTIYTIEERKAGLQCLVHWGPGIEPSWFAIQNVDTRAVKEFQKCKTKAEKKKQPSTGDPSEIIFEEEQVEGVDKSSRKFLVRWTDTGIVTWEIYGVAPGVTRDAAYKFMAERKTWKRYRYT